MTLKDFKPGPMAEVSHEIEGDEATLIFQRRLPHSPEKVWRALTQPNEQIAWLPFVADREIGTVGPCMLRMMDREDASDSSAEVLRADPARLLSFQWGSDVLHWALEPDGRGTRLTLRHVTSTADQISSFAAGWHICIDVLAHFLDGEPVGAIVGEDAMNYGWVELNDAYAEMLGGQP